MKRSFSLPHESDLGLVWIANATGLAIGCLPNGCLFAIEHRDPAGTVMINQVLGAPLFGGIGRVLLRVSRPGKGEWTVEVVGPGARVRIGAGRDRCVWESEVDGLLCRVTLWLARDANVWLWRVEVECRAESAGGIIQACLIQDLGLGARSFVMNNEAYASQYIDHHIVHAEGLGSVIMSRQALPQDGRYPWAGHVCLDGAVAFATDAAQIFGPGFRDQAEMQASLPSERLQHECACVGLSGPVRRLAGSETEVWTFAGIFVPDHPAASSEADLGCVEAAAREARLQSEALHLVPAARSLLQDAAPLAADDLDTAELDRLWPDRRLEERDSAGRPLSFFVPDGALNRHIVLRAKERMVTRRHGALLRSGASLLPDENTLCATVWAHGVFSAQLTIGNTAFHKLISVSRDPYNITRASGLRMLVDAGGGWHLLTVPSAFEMGLAACRWIYRWGGRTVTIQAAVSGSDPAIAWQISVEGAACRFLVFGDLVLGEREWEHAGTVTIDSQAKRVRFRPDSESLWGRHYPQAVCDLVISPPSALAAIGGSELLFPDDAPQTAVIAFRTHPVTGFAFAIMGSMADPASAEALADRFGAGVSITDMLASAVQHWTEVARGLRITGPNMQRSGEAAALDAMIPWFVHDAMIHLTMSHGLEQYTGAAWGTRDVCQGPVECLLALEHDEAVREIVRTVFAQQYETRGDWPQWFMLEPYATLQDPHAHGDVIIWPLKALCDYVEATGDLAFLDEPVAWRRDSDFTRTDRQDTYRVHVDKLLATVRDRFVPGTYLLQYGEGDWNDSLQPVDPGMRDRTVSAWTVALLIQQIGRYAAILGRDGSDAPSRELKALADGIRADFHRYLVRDGVVAGYTLFPVGGGEPELLLHPSDRRTGVRYSLIVMTRALIVGLFDEQTADRHIALIREHLLFPDGVRLMDRPIAYHGGRMQLFRRAESAAYFGREIGLMYTHAHLRYAEAMAAAGDAEAAWRALMLVNPIAVTDLLPHAARRQRNAYFSSSDAAFPDRYAASNEWERVKAGTVPVEGGWRIYSSGPGIYLNLLVRTVFGRRR